MAPSCGSGGPTPGPTAQMRRCSPAPPATRRCHGAMPCCAGATTGPMRSRTSAPRTAQRSTGGRSPPVSRSRWAMATASISAPGRSSRSEVVWLEGAVREQQPREPRALLALTEVGQAVALELHAQARLHRVDAQPHHPGDLLVAGRQRGAVIDERPAQRPQHVAVARCHRRPRLLRGARGRIDLLGARAVLERDPRRPEAHHVLVLEPDALLDAVAVDVGAVLGELVDERPVTAALLQQGVGAGHLLVPVEHDVLVAATPDRHPLGVGLEQQDLLTGVAILPEQEGLAGPLALDPRLEVGRVAGHVVKYLSGPGCRSTLRAATPAR